MQTVLQRPDKELIKQIYLHQKANPSPGDWCYLIDKDFELLEEQISEEQIIAMSPSEYKKYVKSEIQKYAFQYLEGLKTSHSKVRDNQYQDLEKPQKYITSKLFTNDQCFLIFALKSKTLRGVKTNTISVYQENYLCPLCKRYPDTQEHIGSCRVLQDILPCPLSTPIDYSDLSGTVQQQMNFPQNFFFLRKSNCTDTFEQILTMHENFGARQIF